MSISVSSQPRQGFHINRRTLLKLSGTLCGGFSLASILRQRSCAESRARHETAVIFVQLGGGASHFETYDPKPHAAAEYRGEFGAISTAVPGTRFCELMPRQAQLADQLSIVRSVQHHEASHIALHVVETGYFLGNSANALKGETPSVGAVVSKVRAGRVQGLPEFVSVPKPHAYSGPAWLGGAHNFFAVNDDPNEAEFAVDHLQLLEQIPLARLEDRRGLRRALDRAQRTFEASSSAQSIDEFSRKAFELVTSDRARRAFDLAAEDPALRDRYGRNTFGQRLLLARRLVEAGIPFAVVRMFGWDDHEKLPEKMRERGPEFDQGLATLITDLHDRGLARHVLVVAMGEFGRTPRINPNAGRDHWPRVSSVLLSGGRFQMGRIVGGSDTNGSTVVSAPYAPQNVLAMVYRHLEIDPAATFPDFAGRPRSILEERRPIDELL